MAQALGIQTVGRNLTNASRVIEAASESIQIYLEFDGAPEVHIATASLLGLLGLHLATPDRLPEAVDALRESVARFAAVPELPHPLVFEQVEVARHLTLFLIDLGDYPEAVRQASVTLDLMRTIEGGAYFATDPGIFEQRLRLPYTTPPDTLREAVHRMAGALADGLPTSSATRRPHWIM